MQDEGDDDDDVVKMSCVLCLWLMMTGCSHDDEVSRQMMQMRWLICGCSSFRLICEQSGMDAESRCEGNQNRRHWRCSFREVKLGSPVYHWDFPSCKRRGKESIFILLQEEKRRMDE